MSNRIRWGILGTGNIARRFAGALKQLPGAELVAIASRSLEKAREFAYEFDVPYLFSRYEELAGDKHVEVVYVATPHAAHKDNALLCLAAGKAVLCEKPFTINAAQAREVIAFAREKKLFLMEAMWTRCFPAMNQLGQLLRAGAIGDARMLHADFGFRAEFKPDGRLFNPALGGGALLDIGVYPVALASFIFGSPKTVSGLAHLGPTGVDEEAAMVLQYERGQLAVLSTSIRTTTPQEAVVLGTAGLVRIHAPWWKPTSLTLCVEGRPDERLRLPVHGEGYQLEAAEVMRCLRDGLLESPFMPLDETVSIMETLDKLRALWGLRYPME
jgi:predicted dehydrogenase